MTHLFTYGLHSHGKYIWKKIIDFRRVTEYHSDEACSVIFLGFSVQHMHCPSFLKSSNEKEGNICSPANDVTHDICFEG